MADGGKHSEAMGEATAPPQSPPTNPGMMAAPGYGPPPPGAVPQQAPYPGVVGQEPGYPPVVTQQPYAVDPKNPMQQPPPAGYMEPPPAYSMQGQTGKKSVCTTCG